jgi:formyl-CoA transferase
VTVTSGTPRSVQKIAALLGEPAEDYLKVEDQKANTRRLDELLATWIGRSSADECLEAMQQAEVVASRIYSIEDIMSDPVYREREDIVTVADEDFGSVRMQAVVPKFTNHPGAVWRTGPSLGADNEVVFREKLGLDAKAFAQLEHDKVI